MFFSFGQEFPWSKKHQNKCNITSQENRLKAEHSSHQINRNQTRLFQRVLVASTSYQLIFRYRWMQKNAFIEIGTFYVRLQAVCTFRARKEFGGGWSDKGRHLFVEMLFDEILVTFEFDGSSSECTFLVIVILIR